MIQSFLFQSDKPSNSLGDPCRRVGKLGILIPICIKINLLVLYPLKQEEEEAPQIYCGLIPIIPPLAVFILSHDIISMPIPNHQQPDRDRFS